ncbi:diaminobutyrate acetyltransferase [Isoptericola sp. BMS4]|uniref:diaminobutyrate acetyltransferase n=1 Tax=Isoptericola sp. BMS4 TaxID=2527875 RepID=UPI00141DEB9A|nr:diaminobutyrate acetyltransferase [Isoptericola sp. BMS4]
MDTTDTATTNHPTDSTDHTHDAGAAPGPTGRTSDDPADGDPATALVVRAPRTSDGAAMWRLARDTGSLDLNSSYAYLLLADHFSATCRIAFLGDRPVGFLSAYRLPADPSRLFVWQVAVDEQARGRRVAARMLDAVVDETPGVTSLATTVTEDNTASRRLFARFAARRDATLRETTGYEAADFPDGHEAEPLLLVEGLPGPRDR